MVEENAATGARLDGELERARGECATLRGELRDVRGALPIVLNNNASNSSSNSNNNSGTATSVSSGTNPSQEAETQQQAQQEDGKRLSAGSSPIEKRSSASDKSASPIDKRTSPVDRKDRTSPIERRASPIGPMHLKHLSYHIDRSCASRRGIHRRDRRLNLPYRAHCIRLGSDARSNKGWLHSSDFFVRQYKSFSVCCYFSPHFSSIDSSATVHELSFVRVFFLDILKFSFFLTRSIKFEKLFYFSSLERRNGSPCRSPSEKARRPYAPALEKTRLGGSGGSVDSRSGSASPDRGSTNRSGFLHRGGSDRSSVERLRISTNRDSLRSSKEMNDHDQKDADKDLVDGDARGDEDNEPPGPAPGSRPSSPANSLGIGDPVVASRLSNLHGGGHAELASARRLRLENERLVAEIARLRRLLLSGAARGEVGAEDAAMEEEARFVALEMELQHAKEALQALKTDRKRLKAEKFDLLNQMKALYGTLEDKERELRDFIRNYEQRMRENEATLGRLQQQGAGMPSEERERERERERWSLLRAARDEADRSLSLAASLADKEAALSHAHATIKELQRQLAERGGGGGGICLSDQESLVSFPRGSVNGAATPGAGSSSGGGGGGGGSCGIIPHVNSQPPLSTELGISVGNMGGGPGAGGTSGGQAGDRGSCSADSGVRGSSDRESGGATSVGGNLSDSTTDEIFANGRVHYPIQKVKRQVTLEHASSSIAATSREGSFLTAPAQCTPTITVEGSGLDMDSISVVSSVAPPHIYQSATTPKDCSPTLSPLNAFSRSMDNSSLSRSVEQLSSPLESEPRRNKQPPPVVAPAAHSRSSATRGGTWGSISRVFARSRHRKTANSSSGGSGGNEGSDGFDPYRSWSPLTEEGYAEKLRLLREAASVPMERWRAPTVLAWLEVALGMPQYGPRCAENVKSGKVLLELNDAELEAGLGVTHPLHRKKLRLAIEEHRHPSHVRYPCIAQLGHTWVSSEWLPDLGLAQYSESFATNMVDARMLDQLSKKELEKLLGVTRKFHQASIVHGIHLLRMLNYDRQALAVRRHQCEQVDTDPLVWTNQRFIRWARNIDLTEYAENLKDSGVHGALVVLEPSFTGDTMATALGIPPAKHMIRRHLTAELEALVLPARGDTGQRSLIGMTSSLFSSSSRQDDVSGTLIGTCETAFKHSLPRRNLLRAPREFDHQFQDP
ncbi:Kazrin [Cyphomyrmex costatus]|uniref:Kazrin n=1 Tax=Cyphomyrmex costatus TaxID=456900 RepID=A0A195CU13_9HYME|nr:Kazrin [Cyphomyrmex costatus]